MIWSATCDNTNTTLLDELLSMVSRVSVSARACGAASGRRRYDTGYRRFILPHLGNCPLFHGATGSLLEREIEEPWSDFPSRLSVCGPRGAPSATSPGARLIPVIISFISVHIYSGRCRVRTALWTGYEPTCSGCTASLHRGSCRLQLFSSRSGAASDRPRTPDNRRSVTEGSGANLT